MRYQINHGYDSKGRPKNRYFPSMEAATKYAAVYFRRTGIVLGIVLVRRKRVGLIFGHKVVG